MPWDPKPVWPYLGAAPDDFSTDVQLCQNPLNLVKFIFLIASVFYNGAFNLFFLCLLGFLLSGTCRPPFFPCWKWVCQWGPLWEYGPAQRPLPPSDNKAHCCLLSSLLSSASSISPLSVSGMKCLEKSGSGFWGMRWCWFYRLLANKSQTNGSSFPCLSRQCLPQRKAALTNKLVRLLSFLEVP